MALRLLVLTAKLDPPPQVLIKGRRAVLGRKADCEVRLPDPSVSKVHASIVKRGANFLLIDEGSRHGTVVAAEGQEPVQLAAECPRVLQDGDHIWVGQVELLARLEAAKRGEASGYETLAPTLVRAGLMAANFEPTAELIASTLEELTELEDELAAPESEPRTPPDWNEKLGVADLAENDSSPPWRTDAFVALLAIVIASGCLWSMNHLMGLY